MITEKHAEKAEKAEKNEKTGERHIVHIINPVSGSGKKYKKIRRMISDLGEDVYLTKRESDCEDFVAEFLTKDPYAHIVAHGGDGTMGETASGIMAAGAGATAVFSGIPAGSGNDLLHYLFETKNTYGKKYPLDLVCANGRYSVNIANMGFDCTVVSEAEKIRRIPAMGGSLSYILGVVSTLMKKESFKTTIVMKDVKQPDGTLANETLSDDFLLAAVANGRYYGGGFKVAPLADANDGFIDLLAVKNVSVPRFASLVSGFKKGTHLNENGNVIDRFKEFLSFKRCRAVSFDGIKEICYDGEIVKAASIDAHIVPSAILYTPPEKTWLI